jgi:phosphatidylethanolamine-binding protein (PEBP) family uncharacterized protein
MEDPDAPLPRPIVHLLVTAIPAALSGFDEGATEGIQILALNAQVALKKTPSRRELAAALSGKVIARGRLDGYFER